MTEDRADAARRYREAMAKLRPAHRGQPLGELPEDPDAEHVPPELAALDGHAVTVTGIERETGELVRESGVLVTVPGLHGDVARRGRDGDS